MILGIDPGTRMTGWAIWSGGERVTSGRIRTSRKNMRRRLLQLLRRRPGVLGVAVEAGNLQTTWVVEEVRRIAEERGLSWGWIDPRDIPRALWHHERKSHERDAVQVADWFERAISALA